MKFQFCISHNILYRYHIVIDSMVNKIFTNEILFCNIKATGFTSNSKIFYRYMKIAHFSRELFYT